MQNAEFILLQKKARKKDGETTCSTPLPNRNVSCQLLYIYNKGCIQVVITNSSISIQCSYALLVIVTLIILYIAASYMHSTPFMPQWPLRRGKKHFHLQAWVARVRVCNYVKFETGLNLLPVLKIVTSCHMLCVDIGNCC